MKNTTDLRGEQAVRYKMYKAKKQWLVAGAISVALLAGGHITARAETSATAESSPPTSQTQSATSTATTETTTPSADTVASSTQTTPTTPEAAPVENTQTPEVATSTEPATTQQTTQASESTVASTTPSTSAQTSTQSSPVQSSPVTQTTTSGTTAETPKAASTTATTSSSAKSDTGTADKQTDTKKAETKKANTTEPAKEVSLDQQADKSTQVDEVVDPDDETEIEDVWVNPGADIDESKYDKGYIKYDEVKDADEALPNIEYGRIFATENGEDGPLYYGYNEEEKEFVEITDEKDLAEIQEAIRAGVVTRDYMTTTNVQEGEFWKFWGIQSDRLPDGFPEDGFYVLTNFETNFTKPGTTLPENTIVSTERFFTKLSDGNYYWYDAATTENPFHEQVSSGDLAKIMGGDNFEIRLATTAELENYDLSQGETYNQFKIIQSNTLPGYVGESYYLEKIDLVDEEFKQPGSMQPGDGFNKYTIYFDGQDYFEAEVIKQEDSEEDTVRLVKLEEGSDLITRYQAAKQAQAVKNTHLAASQTEALQQALTNKQSFVKIGDDIYQIQLKHSLDAVPVETDEDGNTSKVAYISILKPNALPVTETKTPTQAGTDLLEIQATNPGVDVSLFDYWVLKNADGSENENPTGISNLGINNGHDLKFSIGSGIPFDWNNYNSSNMTQGIVQKTLDEDGFPVLAVGNTNESLKYLFDNQDGTYKKVVIDNEKVPMFISDGNGGYMFNSYTQHADFESDTNLENGTWKMYNKPNNPNGGFATDTGEFFPLNHISEFFEADADSETGYGDPKAYVTGFNQGMNHYFGMMMETSYIHPDGGMVTDEDGNLEPMVFNFSGDDDFWLFIDGTLVLDIGGIHQASHGTIDFANDLITYITNTGVETTTTISQAFEGVEVEEGKEWNASQSEHTMKMFYLERGNDITHLKVDFNLQIPDYYHADKYEYGYKEGGVVKQYTYGESNETLSYTIPTQFLYGVHDKYGVQWTPKDTDPTPPNPPIVVPPIVTPTPDPDPTPTPTPDPDPEDAHTPDVDPDTEVDPVTPAVPEDSAHTPATPAGSVTQVVAPAADAKAAQTTPTAAETSATPDDTQKMASSMLPQTGETTDHVGLLGLMMVGLTGLLGLFGLKKKKEQ
ncbi:KxYKxGKxW signal peptide domain-containing protein [Lactobacillus sp. LC28-10]|uniref:KxYKxGKxW signal peptide domain-containing protein n=1 Tax=Secundilactobacillus angelensis TaxID=2722706 RepID=A0ABX1KYB8_9LACO|nr:KxYKxGKxW signal peptide domain-containing protein [Secundilactobacillus angelensis]MCH5462022.1 KxYKxGKxW signal peptide domain-containing protein [Secundilactobacillus angelensis]NLR18944.1 KxYKxGKxW signal peptide domain-containing protein [Secundilactobacillus angelensis]